MLSAVEKVLFLMRTGLTGDASTDALSRLASAASDQEVARGERLFSQGEDADVLWIVLDGAVRVDVEGAPARLAEAGDWLGALPLFAGGIHRGAATALVTTRLLRIERAELYDLLDEDGELARALLSGLSRTLSGLLPAAAEAI